jgi:ABC-type uncharacterized transport system permease subunit
MKRIERPARLRVEKRPIPSGRAILSVSILAILAALAAVAIFFASYGISPLHAYGAILKGTFGSWQGFSETLRRMIPLLLCGVGLTVAFRALFWNIGADGQLLSGAIAATWVALFSGLHGPIVIPMMFLAGFAAGAVWGLIPAVLKVKMGINDVITTLMMNYIAMYIVLYLIHGPWKGPSVRGYPLTDIFSPAARLPTIGNTHVHWPTLLLGLFFALAAYIMLNSSKSGFEIQVVGENPYAARFAGISELKAIVTAMLTSGGLAGVAGVGEVAGVHLRLFDPNQISMGYGYTAIIVAWLARKNPLAVIVTSFFFGVLMAGGDVIKVNLGLPFQLINVFNGVIMFFLIGSEIFMKYRIVLQRK